MRWLIIAILLALLSPTVGEAQNFGNIPSNTVIGNAGTTAAPAKPTAMDFRATGYYGNVSNDTTSFGIGYGTLGASRAAYPVDVPYAYNTAIGSNAGPLLYPHNTTDPLFFGQKGVYNTCVGLNACQFAVDIYGSTAVGVGALGSQLTPRSTGAFNNALGTFALAGLGNMAGIGQGSPPNGQYAAANDCFGSACGQAITSGYGNSGFGLSAINFIREGFFNDCFGASSCLGNTYVSRTVTGNTNSNTSVTGLSTNVITAGWQVGMRIDDTAGDITQNPATTIAAIAPGGLSVTLSKPAVASNTGTTFIVRFTDGNSPIGASDGYQNTAMGVNSLEFIANGQSNVGVGSYVGQSIADGSFNTFIGAGAGSSIVNGSNNLLLGFYAGNNLTAGSRNIMLGTSNNCQAPAPWANDYFMVCASAGITPAFYTTLISGAIDLTSSGWVSSQTGFFRWGALIGHASGSEACTTGVINLDAGYIYVCTGLGGSANWKRVALSTF